MSFALQLIQLLPNVSITPANPTLLTLIAPKYIQNDIQQTVEYSMNHNEEKQFITVTMEYKQFWNVISKHLKGNELLILIDDILNSDQTQKYTDTYQYLQYDSQHNQNIKKTQSEMYELANKFWNFIHTEKDIEIPKIRRIAINELSCIPFKHLYQMCITSKVCKVLFIFTMK